ncbi:hypothetical protein CD191_07445 [Paenibacillus odorifer]|uniref:Uncharacterized protein n=1 Tax=Paenibacillus odorifer TaxID=189426 RepID=A0AAD0P270_9BACL|nr:hypothetical protein CD191_07445 [Paenibacillus odorifer]
MSLYLLLYKPLYGMARARTEVPLIEIGKMMPPTCLLWLPVIRICWIQTTLTTLTTLIILTTTIITTEITRITILDLTAGGIAGVETADIVAVETAVGVEMLAGAVVIN